MILSLEPVSKALQKQPFDCGNPILNDYFRLYAFKNDQLSIGKTFVALNDLDTVTGYMTLANAQIEVDLLPETLKAKLPRYPIPAFRIAKLAVDLRYQGSGVGSWILRSALEKALSVSASVGIYAVIVDAIDEKTKSFYVKYGFVAFSEYRLTLFLPITTIASAYSRK
ncbi:MAG: GNAT family N-acetyltransferase [Dehalococcoidales bacterium]|nr:GNAT family N-acetyltransferase [Dehalococcoidales bacterium]